MKQQRERGSRDKKKKNKNNNNNNKNAKVAAARREETKCRSRDDCEQEMTECTVARKAKVRRSGTTVKSRGVKTHSGNARRARDPDTTLAAMHDCFSPLHRDGNTHQHDQRRCTQQENKRGAIAHAENARRRFRALDQPTRCSTHTQTLTTHDGRCVEVFSRWQHRHQTHHTHNKKTKRGQLHTQFGRSRSKQVFRNASAPRQHAFILLPSRRRSSRRLVRSR